MDSGNFLIRSAREDDLDDLYNLSNFVYFINLPDDRDIIEEKISLSIDSFAGKIKDKFDREYILVMEDLNRKNIVGTSTIIGRHGSPDSPHMFFELKERKKYSDTIHTGFIHKVLKLGFDYDGPTEIGGLVVSPNYRKRPEKFGRQLSFARFQFIKMRRRWFKDRIISELMPPLSDEGESILWEAIGRKFTNLSYEEADILSRNNKEFVTSLFPKHEIFVTLLPAEARDVIGRVGDDTEPVKHMLQKIGFEWKEHIDPFDGGPHYWAETDKVSLIRDTKKHRIHKDALKYRGNDVGLIGISDDEGYRCVQAPFQLVKNKVVLPKYVTESLEVESGQVVFVTPLT